MFAWQNTPMTGLHLLGIIIGAIIVLLLVLITVMYEILAQRKFIGWIQRRIGPNRVGPWGLLQTAADVLKLLIKEDVIPEKADKAMFSIAPIIAFVPAFMVLALVPYTMNHVFTAGMNVGVLFYIALSPPRSSDFCCTGISSSSRAARSFSACIARKLPCST